MHPEVEELRPKLKEILYDCAVDVRATKAALYLFDGTSRFELVTEYGFRGGIRESADFHDPIVDRCGRGRTPFFVNGVATEPRFSQILFDAATDRLLVVPLYSRGKLIGFIDMRDKAGKAPFLNEDVQKAQKIADRTIEVFADRSVFGHRFITLSAADEEVSRAESITSALHEPSPIVVPPPPAAAEAAPARLPSRAVPRLATVVIDARAAASRITAPQLPPTLTESEIQAASDVLRGMLLLPGAVVAALSAFGPTGGVQEIVARSTLTEDARQLIQSKLQAWLAKRSEGAGAVRTSVSMPFGEGTPPVTAADVQKVFTAPLRVGSMTGLYLTVAFSTAPERSTHELLGVLHAGVQTAIEHCVQRNAATTLRRKTAEHLLEPEFSKFPELRRHAELVSRLCEVFAVHLGLTGEERETAGIAGLVHDCGMRLLDYERLYRKRDLSPEEQSFLREHPLVSAAMVEPLLGPELARIVLCHHERVDGRGYPNGLRGEDIPLLSRVVQICDAWIAMTDPETYQMPEPRDSALSAVAQAAGTQFDAQMAGKFVEMMRGEG